MTFNVNQVNVSSTGQVQSSTGSISLIAATGVLNIGANAVIYATSGNIVIENNNTLNGTIAIGAGADVDAAYGNTDIVIGAIPGTPVVGTQPANTTLTQTGGGIIYWGTNSITASTPTNAIKALARNVIFNTGTEAASAISLGGNVTIIADPPGIPPHSQPHYYPHY